MSNRCRDGREIQVRTLAGESTILRIPHDATTIHDLKLSLKLSFPPASSSNFHLFFKGVKLSLQNRVDGLSMEPGDFLVLMPFAKKELPQTQPPDFSSSGIGQTSVSDFADSTYSDLMQEFSYMEESDAGDTNKVKEDDMASPDCSHGKRKRDVDYDDQERSPYDFLWGVLRSSDKDLLEGENSEKFVKVLESFKCLSSPRSRKCLLLKEVNIHGGDGWGLVKSNGSSCLCPAWLKNLIEAFAFLSHFSALLQLQKVKLTLSRLKGALAKLEKFKVQFDLKDINYISVLCPKVVRFANSDTELLNFDAALVIVDSLRAESEEVEGNNNSGTIADALAHCIGGMSMSKISSTMKKRERSFKTHLWQTIKLLMSKYKTDKSFVLSLENLLMHVKDGSSLLSSHEATRARTGRFSASGRSVQNRCYETNQLLPLEIVKHLASGIGSTGQMVHVEDIDARKAISVEIPNELSEDTKSVLKSIGINKFYIHQADSISASLSGKNIVVATMTSSGKSLCYNVPVLEELSNNSSSCALYLFPTKALAQDQLRALLAMTNAYNASINVGVYDGDTSQMDRTWLRDKARLLITNPDMLHTSILPLHGQFSRILSNIRYVVIDEAHSYKGAFGCHTALILRRLRRLCSHVYGSDPSFIFCTATSANPREHCMELANVPELELINNDGSPSSRKLFVLWNPYHIQTDGELTKDLASSMSASKPSSAISDVSNLFAEMVQHGLRCIAFCRSRKLCELVLCYTREILEKTAPHLLNSICSYRGGYMAEDRRRIEGDLFGGKICGIAATNALELGIDVGHIDVTLHLGFPGSIASLWQQAGRSGRRERDSLAVFVAFEGPLDQYFMKFPKKLFSSSVECCHIDAQNPQVLEQHLACAALEHPLNSQYDVKYFGGGLDGAITNLKSRGYLTCNPTRNTLAGIWNYIGHEKRPSSVISIRAIETEKYRVVDAQSDEVLEEVEESKAFFQVYDGAVYLNQGKTYLVKELDTNDKIAYCKETSVNYYTKPRDYTDIHVMGSNLLFEEKHIEELYWDWPFQRKLSLLAYPLKVSRNHSSRTTAQAQTCKVTTTWFGFYRMRKGSNEVLDVVDLSLPKYSYESQAVWIQVPQSIKSAVETNFSFRSGLHAASHAILHVVPLYVRCNYSDLAPECPNPHETRYSPERILLYDQHPGGTGVSRQIQPYFKELLEAALELLVSCCCSRETGCPNCVQNLACREYNELVHKDAAIMIIKGVLDAEKLYFQKPPENSD